MGTDKESLIVSTEEAKATFQQNGFQGFIECSAFKGDNLNKVFLKAMQVYFKLKAIAEPTDIGRKESIANNGGGTSDTGNKGFCNLL